LVALLLIFQTPCHDTNIQPQQPKKITSGKKQEILENRTSAPSVCGLLFRRILNLKVERGLNLTTEIALVLQNISYKYKLSILLAIVFTCLSRLVLLGSGSEHEWFRYFIPLLVGGTTGYFTGYFLDYRQKLLLLSRRTNSRLKKKLQEQRAREAWYTTLFKKNHSILILINSTTGLIEEANPSACEFYGYSIEQFKKMHISELNTLPGEVIDYEIVQAKIKGRQKLFSRHKLASGEERDVELFSESIVINGTSFLFLVVSDITDQKVLQGIIPVCSHCKQIRDDEGDWNQIEEYIQRHSEARFSHGLCPSCAQQHYPNLYEHQKN
jgi:PAS domain S-box-containing protein